MSGLAIACGACSVCVRKKRPGWGGNTSFGIFKSRQRGAKNSGRGTAAFELVPTIKAGYDEEKQTFYNGIGVRIGHCDGRCTVALQ